MRAYRHLHPAYLLRGVGSGGGIWGLIFVLGSFLNLILCKEPWREVKLKVALWVPFPWPLPPPEGFVCKNLAAAQLGRL